MDCSKVLELIYYYSDNEYEAEGLMPFFTQIRIWLHVFFCENCAKKIEKYETTKEIMQEEFFPPSPGFEESIMRRVVTEEDLKDATHFAIPGGLSTRGWVITGLIVFISLTTAFFGLDFQNIVKETGTSFLLPVGITIGIVLTSYGAFFIGSHLKELTERFGL
jgi:hypothetical protein